MYLTTYGLLGASLHPSINKLLVGYSKYLSQFGDILEIFTHLAKDLKDQIISIEDLKLRLSLNSNLNESDVIIITNYYEFACRDDSFRRDVYTQLSNIIYKEIFASCNSNFEVFAQMTRMGTARIPTYNGTIEEKNFKCIGLEDVKFNLSDDPDSFLESFMPFINRSIMGQRGYLVNSLIAVSAPPSYGKSLFMIEEAIHALRQNKRVLYAAFGDIDGKDFKSRMTNIILKKDMNVVFNDLENYYAEAKKVLPAMADKNKFKMEIISPSYFNIDEWIEINDNLGSFDNYDVIFVDYDGNIKSSNLMPSSSYEQEGYKYDRLKSIAAQGKWVFVGSQTKIVEWDRGVIGLEGMADSSKKQNVLDLLLTISRDRSGLTSITGNKVGTINIAKNRRGSSTSMKYFIDISGEFTEISNEVYDNILNSPRTCTLTPELAVDGVVNPQAPKVEEPTIDGDELLDENIEGEAKI